MGGGIAMLLVGFLVGGAAASAVWAFIVFGKRRAVEAEKAEMEQIMASVGETLAEADAIETNFRSGALTPEAFRRHLGDRVNVVMRLLRTNMHALDAYFVKYAEQEAREYLRLIDNPERRRQEAPDLTASNIDAGAGMELPDPPETNLFAIAPAAAPHVRPEPIDDTFPAMPPLPAAPAPSLADDTANRYEQPFAAPAPAPAPSVIDTADDFEPPPAPAPGVAYDAADRYEQPLIAPAPAPTPSVIDTADDFEPSFDAPAPGVIDTANRYEQPFAAPAPSVIDTANRYEQPFAAPAPSVIDMANQYEQPFAAPAPSVIDTANQYEQPFAPPAPSVIDTANRYEQPFAAPAPSVIDTANRYEQPFAPPAPSVIDTANRYEQPFAAPAPSVIDTVDDFEPPPVPADTAGIYGPPPAAPVREEELVLGESPEDRSAAFAYGPAPAQAGGDSFEIAAPPAPAAPPQALSPGDAAWTGGDSIEEFEAAFAQFEIPASQVHETEYEETGKFSMADVVDGPRTPIPAMETPPPQTPPRQIDDHELTETSSIDRNAILNAMAAAGQALPAVQTPLSVQAPPLSIQIPPQQPLQPPPEQPPPPPPQSEHQGITGDDVVDSIDNFFKLN